MGIIASITRGNWEFDPKEMVISHVINTTTVLDLRRCTTSAELLDALLSSALDLGSNIEDAGVLIRFVAELLDPGSHYCPLGRDLRANPSEIIEEKFAKGEVPWSPDEYEEWNHVLGGR